MVTVATAAAVRFGDGRRWGVAMIAPEPVRNSPVRNSPVRHDRPLVLFDKRPVVRVPQVAERAGQRVRQHGE
ncbi:MAG TPA: hypothetical protein VMV69_25470 [Pirellulales bacterium]|nr:hypothetical protein [Pirellulales bacterium]